MDSLTKDALVGVRESLKRAHAALAQLNGDTAQATAAYRRGADKVLDAMDQLDRADQFTQEAEDLERSRFTWEDGDVELEADLRKDHGPIRMDVHSAREARHYDEHKS